MSEPTGRGGVKRSVQVRNYKPALRPCRDFASAFDFLRGSLSAPHRLHGMPSGFALAPRPKRLKRALVVVPGYSALGAHGHHRQQRCREGSCRAVGQDSRHRSASLKVRQGLSAHSSGTLCGRTHMDHTPEILRLMVLPEPLGWPVPGSCPTRTEPAAIRDQPERLRVGAEYHRGRRYPRSGPPEYEPHTRALPP